MNDEPYIAGEYKFSITYDADDSQLSEHRINASVLAEVIKNIAELIKHSDEILNSGNQSLSVFVSAPAKEGSFAIEFVTQIFDKNLADAVMMALGLMVPTGAVTGGIFKALKNIGGSEVIRIDTATDSKEAVVTLSDDRRLTVSHDEALLVYSPKIRKQIKNIVSGPLKFKNNVAFKIRNDDGDVELDFNDVDVRSIERLNMKSIPIDIKEIWSEIIFTQVNFEGRNGWKIQLSEGTVVSAPIYDDTFLYSISEGGQGFKKEDTFLVKLQIKTYENDKGVINKKYKILEVQPFVSN